MKSFFVLALIRFLLIILVQYIPEWLIPGGGFRRDARECKDNATTARDVPFEAVVGDIVRFDINH